MTSFKDLPIQRKILGLSLLASGSALVLACGAFLIYDIQTYRVSLVRGLSTQAEIIGFNSASALMFQDAASAERTLSALKARPGTVMAGIYDVQGKSFALWKLSPEDGRPLPPFPAGEGERHFFGPNSLVLVRPIVFDGAVIGAVYIESDLTRLRDRLMGYVEIAIAVMFLSFGAAALVSLRLGPAVARPILDLARTAKAVSVDKDYAVRAPVSGSDEVGALGGAFNAMLGQIQVQEEALRRSHDDLEQRVKERTADLEASNKELEAFSYSVSHDLRAPLRSIDGFTQVLMEESGDKINEAGRDSLQRVRAAARRMSELIDDMLSISRLIRQEMRREAVDLGEIAKSIVEDLRRQAPERRVEFVVGEGLQVQADYKLLYAAMENLVGNAWKFTAKKPEARIEVGSSMTDGERTFFIRDNGAGFNMNYAHKLFGVFQRLHTEKDFSGTGIGLATVQRILVRHGGRIWAEGAVGEGATFSFTLPN